MEVKDYKGLWWLPSNAEYKVAGILYYIPSEEFRLELIGSFSSEYDESILAVFNGNLFAPVIHGQVSDGNEITLFDCSCRISHHGRAIFSTATYKGKVIAIGAHLESIEEKKFFKAQVKIPELSYWLYPAMVQQVYTSSDREQSIVVKIEEVPDDQKEVAKIQISKIMTISLCRDASYNSGKMSFTPSFEQFTFLRIESSENTSLKELYEKAVRYEQFMSFATLRNVGFSMLQLYSKDIYKSIAGNKTYTPVIIDTTFHTKPNTKSIDKYKFIFDYDIIKDKYPQIIRRWFLQDWRFNDIREHFLDSIEYKGSFSYINFLVVIQAVEGYARRFMVDRIKNYRKSLPENRRKNVLFEILSAIFSNFIDVRCINQCADLKAISDTRNYHSHLLNIQNKNVVKSVELYNLTEELRKVLICCIMSYVGFSNIEIDTLTHNCGCELFITPRLKLKE